jgi:hypothetical protein
MKKTSAALLFTILAGGSLALLAQSSGPRSLASTLGIWAFPQVGQSPEQQSQDEAACYQWAVQNTGTDPFDLQRQAQQQQQQTNQAVGQAQAAGQGAGVRGAAGGAATGALIGVVAGDAGRGAAIGATAGGLVGLGRRGQAEAQAQQVTAQGQQRQQATAHQMENFRRAFTVCMEGKKYIARF